MQAGERLGPYEILSQLGEGGMGAVYRARDTRLNREVAIKVSAAEFSERFSREASMIAALNHPNICTLFDVGPNFLVMELVEGPTLAERMAGGAIPWDEASAIALQIAEALEAAHEKGIIHRDLKPANVKLTADGKVKVLDFGLAKALDENPAASNPANSPTLAPTRVAATQAGFILGTAAYMAPEQARGHAVDRRADVWAFGVLLWEMVTGRRMFDGETVGDTLAEVLKANIDINAAPVEARPLLTRCLERDRKMRLQAIGEARIALLNPVTAPPVVPTPRTASTMWLWIAAALFAGVAVWALLRSPGKADQPLVTVDVDMGVQIPAIYMGGSGVVLSPDGRRIVYMDEQRRLWTRRLSDSKAVMLPGTDSSQGPFFSPDGKWIGFFSQGKLRKILAEGGSTIPICDSSVGATRGAAWLENGAIIASLDSTSALIRVSANGGNPEPFTKLKADRQEVTHRFPQALPGGKAVIFTASKTLTLASNSTIEVASLADGTHRTLIEGGFYARYVPTGHLIYFQKDAMFAVRFDPDKLQISGAPVPVLENVMTLSGIGYANATFGNDGTLVFRKGGNTGGQRLAWLDAAGEAKPFVTERSGTGPRISPDGKRVVYMSAASVWVYDSVRDTSTKLNTSNPSEPMWIRDGKYIIYGGNALRRTPADGSGTEEVLAAEQAVGTWPRSLTPNGKTLAMQSGSSCFTLDLANRGTPQPMVKSDSGRAFCAEPTFSPDGKWFAYQSVESGQREIYVRPWPDTGGKWQVSSGSGTHPVWSPTGQELFWVGGDLKIWAARYTTNAGAFVAEKPRLWRDFRLSALSEIDISPDGRRFAVVIDAGAYQDLSRATFVFHFFDELKRKMAASEGN